MKLSSIRCMQDYLRATPEQRAELDRQAREMSEAMTPEVCERLLAQRVRQPAADSEESK